jgi:hypothetical protein
MQQKERKSITITIEAELRRRVKHWGKIDKSDQQLYKSLLKRYYALECALLDLKGITHKRDIQRMDIKMELLRWCGELQKGLLQQNRAEQEISKQIISQLKALSNDYTI